MKRLWLKRYECFDPDNIHYPSMPSRKQLELTCLKQEKPFATLFFSQKMKHGELRGKVMRPGDSLETMGVEKSSRPALMLSGCHRSIISYYAELETGAVLVKAKPHRYGISETNPVIRSNIIIALQKVVSEGLPLPDTEARVLVVDTGERVVPSRQPGEPIIRGPQAM